MPRIDGALRLVREVDPRRAAALELHDAGFVVVPWNTNTALAWPWKTFQAPSQDRYRRSQLENCRWEDHNIWILTGRRAGHVGIDCDSDEGHAWWVAALGEEVLNSAALSRSNRGHHHWFKIPADWDPTREIKSWSIHPNDANDPDRTAFDFRADRTGLIVPPSVHKSGKIYIWVTPLDQAADAPLALLDHSLYFRKPKKAGERTSQAGVPERSGIVDGRALAATVLEHAAIELGAMGAGSGRNTLLNNHALDLHRAAKGGFIDADTVDLTLVNAMHDNGYVAEEGIERVTNTLQSARDGAAKSNPWSETGADVASEDDVWAAGRDVKEQLRDAKVRAELEKLEIRAEAQRIFVGYEPTPAPEFKRYTAWLDEPIEPVTERIRGLWPIGGLVLLAAQYKAGKTVFRDNVVRSLVDGDPLLGEFAVERVTRTVVVLDSEMPEALARARTRKQGTRNTDQAVFVGMRGRESSLDVLDDKIMNEWGARLRDVDCGVLIFDCIGPWLAALGIDENENSQVQRALQRFRRMALEAGVEEIGLVHHTTHEGTRSRGASAFLGMTDANWRLIKAKPDSTEPDDPRYFGANGRIDGIGDKLLTYNPDTDHLVIDMEEARPVQARGRRTSAATGRADQIMDYLRESPAGRTTREIADKFGYAKDTSKLRQLLRTTSGIGESPGVVAGSEKIWKLTANELF